MKVLFAVLMVILIAISGYLVVNLEGQSGMSQEEATRLSSLEVKVGEILESQRQLMAALEESKTNPTAASTSRIATTDIERAVDAYLSRMGNEAALSNASTKSTAGKGSGEEFSLEAAVAEVVNPELTWNQKQAIWKKIIAAGLIDEAIAQVELHAKSNPNNPDAQVELGSAYLQKLFTVPEGPEKGTWAMKADKSFDDALKIDEEHWTARFSKASSLSFWPPIFGKQEEAIEHFEILAKQQESKPTQPHYAQTYLYLGNLYQQKGKDDQAKEAWEKGLSLFPQDSQLKAKVKEHTSK